MIGPAVITAFPDAAGGDTGLSSPSRLRRRPQICQSCHQISGTHSEPQTEICYFCTYWHEHDAVVGPTKLGDAVQKHSRHLLVSVFDKTENFKGKTPHLTLPILENCRLRVLIAAVSKETYTCMKT